MRKKYNIAVIFALSTALLLLAGTSHALKVYKTTDKYGNVIFSDRPLSEEQSQQTEINLSAPGTTDSEHHQEYEVEIDKNNKKINELIAKREKLRRKVKQAYSELGIAKAMLKKAHERQEKQMIQCRQKYEKNNGKSSVVNFCQPGSIAPLEVEVVKATEHLSQLLSMLDQMPK